MLNNQEQIREKENHRVFKQLLNTFASEDYTNKKEMTEYAQNIKIIPKIYYDDFNKRMKVEFKIGDKQFYKIKNLPEFYTKMLHGETYQYGTKLNLINKKESFIEESIPILEFILKYAEIMKYTNEATDNYTYYKKAYMLDNIFISNIGLDDLFEALKDKSVTFQRNTSEKQIYFSSREPEIPFSIIQLSNNKFQFKADIDIFGYEILEGKDYIYILFSDGLYRCSKRFEETDLKLLNVLRKNYTNQITIDESELTSFFSVIAPNIINDIKKESLSEKVKNKCVPKPLDVKIFLDYDKNNYITADIRFCYEDFEFNPLSSEQINIARNIIKENEALNRFMNTGFMLDKLNSRLILAQENTIYQFLSDEIEEYMKKYEVLVTDSFRKKEIHSFKIENLGVRVENNLLEIDLSKIGTDLSDLSEILQKYKLKKKFHRLKDGSYIKLEDSPELTFLEDIADNVGLESKKTIENVITLPVYRTLYLDKMLQSLKNVKITKNESYKKIIDELENGKKGFEIEIPKGLNANLRNYQKVGYQWLKTLEEYNFGGILADDMGLRKNYSGFSSNFVICK